jgi:hypothetical protein
MICKKRSCKHYDKGLTYYHGNNPHPPKGWREAPCPHCSHFYPDQFEYEHRPREYSEGEAQEITRRLCK